jgi:hypothetical protein
VEQAAAASNALAGQAIELQRVVGEFKLDAAPEPATPQARGAFRPQAVAA